MPELIAYLEMSHRTFRQPAYYIDLINIFNQLFCQYYHLIFLPILFLTNQRAIWQIWPIRGQFDKFDQSEGNLTNLTNQRAIWPIRGQFDQSEGFTARAQWTSNYNLTANRDQNYRSWRSCSLLWVPLPLVNSSWPRWPRTWVHKTQGS